MRSHADSDKNQKQHISNSTSKAHKVDKAAYYRMAGSFLHSHSFSTSRQRKAWRLHSEGTSLRRTAKEMGVSVMRIRMMLYKTRRCMLAPAQVPHPSRGLPQARSVAHPTTSRSNAERKERYDK